MVFTHNALASGPGMARNSITFTITWGKVKVGKDSRTCPASLFGRRGKGDCMSSLARPGSKPSFEQKKESQKPKWAFCFFQ
jgi:hypothetical protein